MRTLLVCLLLVVLLTSTCSAAIWNPFENWHPVENTKQEINGAVDNAAKGFNDTVDKAEKKATNAINTVVKTILDVIIFIIQVATIFILGWLISLMGFSTKICQMLRVLTLVACIQMVVTKIQSVYHYFA